MPRTFLAAAGTAAAAFAMTASLLSVAPTASAASSDEGYADAARGRTVHDPKNDRLGTGFDIRQLVVRNKSHAIGVKVAMYRGRARNAYTGVNIDPAPRGRIKYAATISMNRRGKPTDWSLDKYRGGKYLGEVRCKKFGAGYFFNKHKVRFTFRFNVPYRCIKQAKKSRFQAYTQNNTSYGYDRTKQITVRTGSAR